MACLEFAAVAAQLSQSGLQAVHLQALNDVHAAELRLTEAAYYQDAVNGKTLSIAQARKWLAAAQKDACMS